MTPEPTDVPAKSCPHCNGAVAYASPEGWSEFECGTTAWGDGDPVRTDRCKITELESKLSESERDITHAISEAKRREPDYPWDQNTASEAVWCLGESLAGVTSAIGDWEKRVAELTAACDGLRKENAGLQLRERLWCRLVENSSELPLSDDIWIICTSDGECFVDGPEVAESLSARRFPDPVTALIAAESAKEEGAAIDG